MALLGLKVQRVGILRCDLRLPVPGIIDMFRTSVQLSNLCAQVQRTMLELLNQLDGFESTSSIKVDIYVSPFP